MNLFFNLQIWCIFFFVMRVCLCLFITIVMKFLLMFWYNFSLIRYTFILKSYNFIWVRFNHFKNARVKISSFLALLGRLLKIFTTSVFFRNVQKAGTQHFIVYQKERYSLKVNVYMGAFIKYLGIENLFNIPFEDTFWSITERSVEALVKTCINNI